MKKIQNWFSFFFQVILTDCTNKRLYLSSDEGLTWSRIDIPFPPDTLVLHPSEPGWILGFSLFDMQVSVKKLIFYSWENFMVKIEEDGSYFDAVIIWSKKIILFLWLFIACLWW